jgi:broad specificity phosphatase PhoE
MIEILIVRHGETAWNTADIFRGRVNIGLSENGLRQAGLLADYLSRQKINAVYSSPLPRAIQTAEAVASRQHLNAQTMHELTDLDFGKWEGVPRQEVKLKYSTIYDQWLERPDLAKIPEGESLADARKRALNALEKIMTRNQEGTVAIVTHRVITKVLICALLGLDDSHFWNVEQDTCGVTTFIHNGRCFILAHHNDICFLKQPAAIS